MKITAILATVFLASCSVGEIQKAQIVLNAADAALQSIGKSAK
jgi:uncharacterized lipoprotein YmbA